MPRGLKEILVHWEVFNFKVWCVIGAHKHLAAYIKKRHRRSYRPKRTEDLGGLYFTEKPGCGGILWLPTIPKTAREIGYLAHEVGHAVIDMHCTRQIELSKDNDETFCYSVAHGVTTILEECE